MILALTLGLDPTQILAFTGVFIVGGISLLRINWKNRITQIEDILEKHYRFWLSLVVFSFLSLVFVVAVIAIRVPSASTFNTVAGSLVTVEGLLLGLIGLTSLAKGVVLKRLVVLTTSSLLWSVVTVMLTQLTVVPLALSAIFLADVGLFALVVASYSISVIRMKPGNGVGGGI